MLELPDAAGRIPLGRSGLTVAPLGWGTWRLVDVDVATARRRVEAALDAGFTLVDTADVYGLGTSSGFGGAETLLGRVLHEAPALRRRMVLATKAGIAPGVPYDARAVHLVAACEASLARLDVEQVDLLQVHRPDLLAHPAEVAGALATLHRQGKIRAAGVSNYTVAQSRALLAHLDIPLASLQPEFSALVPTPLADGVLDFALEQGLGVLAWSPLAQGRIARGGGDERTHAVTAVLDRIAQDFGVPRTAVAYAWIMAHPARPVPLVGAQSPQHIAEALAAFRVRLSRADWYRVLEAALGTPMP
ncbi:MAG: aldo/keto reductase [Proteobacteria bacterium]|nr:aldo/keto reductase [Pseudomonadota bacterium]